MSRRIRDLHRPLRVPDREIGVGPDRDRALLRVQAVDPGRVGAAERDEALEVDPALGDTFGEQKRQAQLDPGNAVRDLLEVGVGPLGELAAFIEAIRRVVGGDHLERAVLHAPPDRRTVRRIPGRRAEHPLRPFEPRPVEVGGLEQQVLRAGLGEHLLTARLGVADRAHRSFGRDVEHDDRLIDQGGHGDQAAHRLGLGDARMADRVEFRRAMAALEQAARGPGEHRVVLGVHRNHRALAPGKRQEVEHLGVVQTQQRIGHEQLERGVAIPDQRRQFLAQHGLGRIGHDHVEGVVDHGLLGALAVVGDHLAHGLAVVLGRERDHRRGAAERRRDRAAVEVVGVPDAHARELLDVAVAVDPAGQHEPACRVDLLRRARQSLREGDDAAAADADVAAEAIGGRDHGAVADDQIEVWHSRKPRRGEVNAPAIAALRSRLDPGLLRGGAL